MKKNSKAKKNNKKNNMNLPLIIGIVAVVLIAVGVAGGYFWGSMSALGGGFNASVKVAVTRAKFVDANYRVALHETITLPVSIEPSNATNKKITCTSGDPKVARVYVSGTNCVVKGIKAGSSTIKAKTSDGSKMTIARVTVFPPKNIKKITGITTKSLKVELYVGEFSHVTGNIAPSNATIKNVNCSSSNTKIFTVSPQGSTCMIRGLKAGTGKLTIKTADGSGKKATVNVVVKKAKPQTAPVKVTSIAFEKTSYSVNVGTMVATLVKLTPTNATNKAITCTSSNTGVATVSTSNNICVVKGIKAGIVTITATAQDGNKKATTKVTVNKQAVINVTGIKFAASSYTLNVGDSKTLTPTITPSNATNKTITCTSSNSSIAKVRVSGNNCIVTGVKAGVVTLRAKSNNGKTASVKITVKKTSNNDPE